MRHTHGVRFAVPNAAGTRGQDSFREGSRLPDLLKLIEHQRDSYLKHIDSASSGGGCDGSTSGTFLTELLLDGAELAVRAELAWLDDVTRKLVMHFGTPAA